MAYSLLARSLFAQSLLAHCWLSNSGMIVATHPKKSANASNWGDYRLLTLFIAMLCFLQCIFPLVCSGVVNQRADRLRRMIAKRPSLHLLLEASEVCFPGVEVGGIQVSLGKFVLLACTYCGILFIGWINDVDQWLVQQLTTLSNNISNHCYTIMHVTCMYTYM